MRFILNRISLDDIDKFRMEYESVRGSLNGKPSGYKLPVLLGGTNRVDRQKQITFIELIKVFLKPKLLLETEIKTPEELHSYLKAAQTMIAACQYVDSQISGYNSAASRIMKQLLGITSTNFLDEEDKKKCFIGAKQFTHTAEGNLTAAYNLTTINKALTQQAHPTISGEDWNTFLDEWENFGKFLNEKSELKKVNPYPITSVTKPLVSTTFAYAGAAVGMSVGPVISNTTKIMTARYQLTAVIGSVLFTFAGPTSIAFIAPVMASTLISSFLSIALAHIFGLSMYAVGKGVGTAIGLPLDLTYKLLSNFCSIVGEYYNNWGAIPLSGLRVADGALMIHGMSFQLMPENYVPEGCTKHEVIFDANGGILIDGKTLETSKNVTTKLPADVLGQIRLHLQKRSEMTDVANKEIPTIESKNNDLLQPSMS